MTALRRYFEGARDLISNRLVDKTKNWNLHGFGSVTSCDSKWKTIFGAPDCADSAKARTWTTNPAAASTGDGKVVGCSALLEGGVQRMTTEGGKCCFVLP
ncbi:hypothetical protein LOK49_LG12G01247 [Camellia lanceoleosa]|uniref:Uncharacterized protein n=1 Tax=Camellia lanceoleosa TaxID=1840588 RepID=A0ACC0FNP2_9ERIC|nr:hypothetical protein LOK49_LG12G01247 [Camellia lanceoleosa]